MSSSSRHPSPRPDSAYLETLRSDELMRSGITDSSLIFVVAIYAYGQRSYEHHRHPTLHAASHIHISTYTSRPLAATASIAAPHAGFRSERRHGSEPYLSHPCIKHHPAPATRIASAVFALDPARFAANAAFRAEARHRALSVAARLAECPAHAR